MSMKQTSALNLSDLFDNLCGAALWYTLKQYPVNLFLHSTRPAQFLFTSTYFRTSIQKKPDPFVLF